MCLRHAPDMPQTCLRALFLKEILSASLPPQFRFEKQLQLLSPATPTGNTDRWPGHACAPERQTRRHSARGALAARPWGEPGPAALTAAQQRGKHETEDTFLKGLEILFLEKTVMARIIPAASAQPLARDHFFRCGHHFQKTLTNKPSKAQKAEAVTNGL